MSKQYFEKLHLLKKRSPSVVTLSIPKAGTAVVTFCLSTSVLVALPLLKVFGIGVVTRDTIAGLLLEVTGLLVEVIGLLLEDTGLLVVATGPLLEVIGFLLEVEGLLLVVTVAFILSVVL